MVECGQWSVGEDYFTAKIAEIAEGDFVFVFGAWAPETKTKLLGGKGCFYKQAAPDGACFHAINACVVDTCTAKNARGAEEGILNEAGYGKWKVEDGKPL